MTHKLDSYTQMSVAQNDTSAIGDTMHAITSGLKVLVEETSVEDVEVARRSMGGHGYTVAPSLAYAAPSMPAISQVQRQWSLDVRASSNFSADQGGYEGDNYVLHQQVIRAALKSYKCHIRSKWQTRPSKISTPVQCIHTCASTRIDLTRLLRLTLRSRPPSAWTNHRLLSCPRSGREGSESRRSICFPRCKGARLTPRLVCDGGIHRWPSV